MGLKQKPFAFVATWRIRVTSTSTVPCNHGTREDHLTKHFRSYRLFFFLRYQNHVCIYIYDYTYLTISKQIVHIHIYTTCIAFKTCFDHRHHEILHQQRGPRWHASWSVDHLGATRRVLEGAHVCVCVCTPTCPWSRFLLLWILSGVHTHIQVHKDRRVCGMHMFDVFKLIAIGRVVWKHRLGQKIVLCAPSQCIALNISERSKSQLGEVITDPDQLGPNQKDSCITGQRRF